MDICLPRVPCCGPRAQDEFRHCNFSIALKNIRVLAFLVEGYNYKKDGNGVSLTRLLFWWFWNLILTSPLTSPLTPKRLFACLLVCLLVWLLVCLLVCCLECLFHDFPCCLFCACLWSSLELRDFLSEQERKETDGWTYIYSLFWGSCWSQNFQCLKSSTRSTWHPQKTRDTFH